MKKTHVTDNDCTYIPLLTSDAGSSITVANWEEASIHRASYSLQSLLMKPGFDFLVTLENLASLVGWSGTLILDASLPKQEALGFYTFRSIYDGRQIRVTADEIIKLVCQLKPAMVIFPEMNAEQRTMVWKSLPDTVFPFFPLIDGQDDHNSPRPFGIFLSYKDYSLQPISLVKNKLCYMAGDIDLPAMHFLKKQGIAYIQSDLPAKDGIQGNLYTREGNILIQDPSMAMQLRVIDEDCTCPVCRQQWTRAYFHHLYQHTPQLCQRFLVQHNVYYCQHALSQTDR